MQGFISRKVSNIVFKPVEANVDFAGPTPPELTADTLMAYIV